MSLSLLDLPLEIFRPILAYAVSGLYRPDHFLQLQLVNKFFARETIIAVCATRRVFGSTLWDFWIIHSLRYRALSLDYDKCYAIRTIHDTAEWLLAQLPDAKNEKAQVYLTVSRAAVWWRSSALSVTMEGVNFTREPWDEQQKQQGKSQTSSALQHYLCAAAFTGRLSLVQSLLAQGTDVNTASDIFGTPLVNAARRGHLEIVRFLLEKGADADAGAEPRLEEIDRVTGRLSNRITTTESEFQARHALAAAAIEGHEEIVNLLLQQRFGISRSTYTFFRAIPLAAQGGNVNILRSILEAADMSSLPDHIVPKLMANALKASAGHGRLDCITFLLDAGADKEHSEKWDRTPLTRAAARGQNTAIELLLQRGADIDERSQAAKAPFAVAAEAGYPRTVALLLDRGAAVIPERNDLKRCMTRSPLCTIKVMLDKGVHTRSEAGGAQALSYAKHLKRWDVVAMLEEYGITPVEP